MEDKNSIADALLRYDSEIQTTSISEMYLINPLSLLALTLRVERPDITEVRENMKDA